MPWKPPVPSRPDGGRGKGGGPNLLIVGLSARMLAAASVRAGWRPLAIDLFADADTRDLAECRQVDMAVDAAGCGLCFDRRSLLAAARMPECRSLPLIVGTGFEDDPDLLAELASGRMLLGNDPETVRQVKDPAWLAEALARFGIPHPPIAHDPPEQGHWLLKRAGGSGGTHIRPVPPGRADEPGGYFQQRRAGEPVSLLFLADGARCLPIGFSAQWCDPAPGMPFRYGGAVGPISLPDSLAAQLAGWAGRIVACLGLRGLNTADFLVDGDDAWLLEINPRPGATLDLFDRAIMPPLLALHAVACAGNLPDGLPSLPDARAVGILYAERTMTVPPGLDWPGWVADRPNPGLIEAGSPVCTVTADEPSPAAARTSLFRRLDGLRARLAASRIFETEIS